MKSMMKDAMILFVITLLAGTLLGTVYEVTKQPIAKQQEKAKIAAYREVFTNAENFEEIAMAPDLLPADLSAYVQQLGYDADINAIAGALDASGSLLGYVITVTDHEGYGGDIQFSMGITKEGVLNGISILSISETAGLGMRAGEVLAPQFAGKQITTFSYTKTGAASEDQIDAISGATITTNAVVGGVNAGIAVFTEYLQQTDTQ